MGPNLAAALVPELRTTNADRPRLDDLLRQAAARSDSTALVLLSGAAARTAAWVDSVSELALQDPAVLPWGRAWSRSGPDAALLWLLEQAAARGWPALDATDAAPLDRVGPQPSAPLKAAPGSAGPQAGIQRLPVTPADAPRFTLQQQGEAPISGAGATLWRGRRAGNGAAGSSYWRRAPREWIR